MAHDPVFRVRFVRDDDARFEECNGEPRPLTEAEYLENEYRGCALHPRAGSKVLDASVSPNVVACEVCGNTEYTAIDYAEYRAYYGNPDQHRYIGVIVDLACGCCGHRLEENKSSLWNIDVMRDGEEWAAIRHRLNQSLTVDQALALPGYLAEVAREQLDELIGYPEKD